MVIPDRIVAAAAALLVVLALAPAAVALHDHDAGGQAAGHADCDACHLRQVAAVETGGTLALSAPDLVADANVSTPSAGELTSDTGINPSRAPPA